MRKIKCSPSQSMKHWADIRRHALTEGKTSFGITGV